MKNGRLWLERFLIFGLSLSACATVEHVKRKPVFVAPIITDWNGEQLICHTPGDYEKLMNAFLE